MDTRQTPPSQSQSIDTESQSTGSKMLGDLLSGLLGNIASGNITTSPAFGDGSFNSVESQQLLAKLQQQSSGQTQQNSTNSLFFLSQNNEDTPMNSMSTMSYSPSEPTLKISSLEEALLSKNVISTNQVTKSPAPQSSRIPTRSKSLPHVSKKNTQKKDGNFVKPVSIFVIL